MPTLETKIFNVTSRYTDFFTDDELLKLLKERLNTGRYWQVGAVLQMIKSARLWRSDYDSFEQYCQKIWDIDLNRALNLIECFWVCRVLLESGINQSQLPKEDACIALFRIQGKGDIVNYWEKILLEKSYNATPKYIYQSVKMTPGSLAVVTSQKHPLLGETVQIKKIKGETVHAFTSVGEQVFISAELCPVLA
ncbi:MAG: hypothetical protein ACKO2Z_33955 [Sphaerospermopsis kisseleviana]